MTKEKQIRIKRQNSDDGRLGFFVSFDPGDDAGDSMFFEYRAFQELLRLGPEFLSSCKCSEVIQRWEFDGDPRYE